MRTPIKVDIAAAVKAEPVSAEAFAPFGHLLTGPGPKNKTEFSGKLQILAPDAKPSLIVVGLTAATLPSEITFLERHPYSSQTFMPLDVDSYLVCVAPSGGGGMPDLSALKAFIVGGHSGLSYNAGVWHHAMVALRREATFSVLMWTCGRDTEFADFDRPVTIRQDGGASRPV